MEQGSQLVTELGVILRQEYGLELTPEELVEVARSLTSFFDLLAKVQHRLPADITH